MQNRKPTIILNEIRSIDKLIIKSQLLLEKYPNDNLLRLSFEQDKFRKSILIEELKESIIEFRRNVIELIIDNEIGNIEIDNFVNHLKSFKSVLSKTIDHLLKGKVKTVPLFFNTVFDGSFGILLTTEYEPILFDYEYNKAIKYSLSTINALLNSNKDNLHSIIKNSFQENKKLIHKYNTFFKNIADDNKNITIKWTSFENEKLSVAIPHDKALSIYTQLIEHEKHEEIISIYGFIKGLSLLRFTIEFQSKENQRNIIKASFDKNISDKIIENIDKLVNCTFNEKVEINENTEEEKRSYILINIIP
jgi:hypothetical protein